MAETAINVVLSKFGELATREAAVLLQVGDDIMLLRYRLEWLQAFIRDADQKRRAGIGDGLTLVWVRQTRDVAFEAEDALDDFFHKVDLQSQCDESWKVWLRYLTGCWSQITVRHGLSRKIESINRRLENISENREKYNVDHTPSRIWTSSATAHSSCWDDIEIHAEDYVVKDAKGLWRLIKDGEKMLISVLGESGSGKNTLVDFVYSGISGMFDFSIWYNMPPDSSTQDLLKQVYKRASKRIARKDQDPDPATNDVERVHIDIAAKLRSLLNEQRYLVVLSGISSKMMLNCVWASLPDDNKGSKVVLILESVNHDVALHGASVLNNNNSSNSNNNNGGGGSNNDNDDDDGNNSILRLSRWDDERSAKLFEKLLGAKEGQATKEDKHYLYAITDGHPLAIVVLAGLLRYKEPVEREALMKQLNPENATDEKSKTVPVMDRILSASYDDLPQDLKSCFLYFAACPKNITHPVEQIVRMWTAEGFIRRRKGKTPEELGRMHLNELVSRCLVRRIRKKHAGSPEKVIVHSRILEFLQSEARQASFIEVHDRCDVLAPASVRRLSIQDDGNGYTPSPSPTKFPKLRSFICRVEEEEDEEEESQSSNSYAGVGVELGVTLGNRSRCPVGAGVHRRHNINFLCRSKFLRVLSVQGMRLEELPDGVGGLIHLRYIRVNCRGLSKLPSSIWKLLNLETLDIMGTKVKEVHPKLWRIKALRHVLAEKLTLPVSRAAAELADLQTLHGVKPAQGGWHGEDCPLLKMTKLRSLELHGLEARNHGVALANALSKMHLIEHLKLEGDVIHPCVFTEPNLRCLHTMALQGRCEWDNILQLDFNVHHVRPNLVQLKLEDISEVPEIIKQELGTKLVEDKNLNSKK